MTITTVVVEPEDRRLSSFMRGESIRVDATIDVNSPAIPDPTAPPPSVLVADLRGTNNIPSMVTAYRKHYPRMGVVIVASSMDPQLMLEAMRAGVSEFVTEPLRAEDLRGAIERLTGGQVAEPETGSVLAFVGAKGGVGTTTVAVNTAMALAADDPGNVAIVDLHLGGHGDVALLLGLDPRFSVADALDNTERLDSAYLKTLVARAKGGVDVLASPNRALARPPDASRMHTLLLRLTERYPTVVLDVPRDAFGMLDWLDPLSKVTLVINQELPAVRRASQIAGLLRQRYGKERVGAVVNRYDPNADIGQDDVERVVEAPVWASLPSDYKKAVAAANSGIPFVSENHTRLAASVAALARTLSGKAEVAKPVKSRGRFGFFF